MSNILFPDITVDAVVFSYIEEQLNVLLIKRNFDPFKNKYALPGSFLSEKDTADVAVLNMLKSETGLVLNYLEQLYTFTNPDRDPRQRIISVSYYGLINSVNQTLQPTKHSAETKWVPFSEAIKDYDFAFDHYDILKYAYERLKNKIRYEPIGFDLLPTYFTLTELYNLYCAILINSSIDRRNFTRKILSYNLLKETNFKTFGHIGRKAKMYEFDKKVYDRLKTFGFNFEL